MTWKIFKWDVEWEKRDGQKHVIYDPIFTKKHIKQTLHMYNVRAYVYIIHYMRIIWRQIKMWEKMHSMLF